MPLITHEDATSSNKLQCDAYYYDESLSMDEWLNFDDGAYYDDPYRFITRFDFPEFHRDSSNTDTFRDWVEEVDGVFDEKGVTEEGLKVTLAVSCFQSSALLWWNNLQLLRVQKGSPEITTWSGLIREMYRQFECAIKWFSIKGNKKCEICQQEVQNLPVTLLRIQSVQIRNPNRGQQRVVQRYRVWQDVPILVIVSMLGYFCFLEQLLVGKMGTGAIAISLPFACILGLLASMTSSTMVDRKYIWVYASVQFVMVVFFAHIFYSLLHVQSILSILLSTFTGFGLAMSGSSIFVEFLRCRRRWLVWSINRRQTQQGTTAGSDQQPEQEQPTQRTHSNIHNEVGTANTVTV
ncbi:hypothetical protein MKX03_022038 [Papaver bracteatum]|nr:hypothetical protein MKX03_022038 [Papaver bracteatum]